MRMAMVLVSVSLIGGLVWAGKPAANRAYVQSGPDGVFYARSIPDAKEGTKGTTTIFRVKNDADEPVDRYSWYARRGVVLGWSPIAGKVAVMAIGGPLIPGSGVSSELSFHLGGKQLASYTIEDFKKWGADVAPSSIHGEAPSPLFKIIGCEQVPATNDYRFVIDVHGKRLAFDILTGKLSAQ